MNPEIVNSRQEPGPHASIVIERPSLRERLPLDQIALFVALAVLYGFFVWFGPPHFGELRTIELIARQTAGVAAAGLGMTLVIAAAGIDLSTGSMVALVTVVIAWLLKQNFSPWEAAFGGVIAGAVCGLFNAVLITGLKIAPFIVTLGTLLAFRGLAKGIAHESVIDVPITWIADLLGALPKAQRWMIVPLGVWLVIVLSVLTAILMRRTRFGLHLFAIGSNESTARLCGVHVGWTKLIIYTLAGALTGVSGLLQFSRLTVGDPTSSVGLELEVIAAVVIGGASLNGGKGYVIGTLVGALFMTTIRTGCSQMGLPNWVQEMVTGGIIVGAVALDRLRNQN